MDSHSGGRLRGRGRGDGRGRGNSGRRGDGQSNGRRTGGGRGDGQSNGRGVGARGYGDGQSNRRGVGGRGYGGGRGFGQGPGNGGRRGTLPGVKKNNSLNDLQKYIDLDLKNVQQKMEKLSLNISTKTEIDLADRKPADEEDVPNDFKSINIQPNAMELLSDTEPFLRPNVILGEYASSNHYLDVQFRLMYEDYFSPMRKGIRRFRNNPNQKQYDGGCFHKCVRFTKFVLYGCKFGIAVRFSHRWKSEEESPPDRFLTGSLLCFTKDNFENIFYGTVLLSEHWQKGTIVVKLLDIEYNEEMFSKIYTMYESDAFYMQYGPVLQILKEFGNHVPMEKYIVKMEECTKPPPYMMKFKNLEDVLANAKQDFDEYQFNAFEKALKSEFVTIQGPPGTGKTYLGTKIASAIIKNVPPEALPILVLCQTNHALDQFLESLMSTTEKIVRVGSQSKSEVLEKYNIEKWRTKRWEKNDYGIDLNEAVKDVRTLKNMYKSLDDDNVIINPKILEKNIPNFDIYKKMLQNKFQTGKGTSYLENWLMSNDFELKSPSSNEGDHLEYTSSEDDISSQDDFSEGSEVKYTSLNNVDVAKTLHLEKTKNENLKDEDHRNLQHGSKTATAKNQTNMNSQNDDTGIINLLLDVDISVLPTHLRWLVYHHWKLKIKEIFLDEINSNQTWYNEILESFQKCKIENDEKILTEADVVGVTTTRAATLRSLLHSSLSSKIVIIEEAAEVLESHIVANLTNKCQHLILLGDHQQLRPQTASFTLGTKFNLEISLFERMFKNEKNCCRLVTQHRMRPEISKLITPSIYSLLIDHESVKRYPLVKGVLNNLHFINHCHYEEKNKTKTSYINMYEAKFVVSFAKYLIQQGYKPEDVTILTPYKGQMTNMIQIREEEETIQNIQICTVDAFQGDQNKIILLSLVRSNEKNRLGFINITNRVCVALSRAREGLFLIGNMDMYERESELWQKIYTTLHQQGSIRKSLSLFCENHGTINEINSPEDFLVKVPDGGCTMPCRKFLPCLHFCQKFCHVDYDKHESYKCKRKCDRSCIKGHPCTLLCFEECNCKIKQEVVLTRCSHKVITTCHIANNTPNDDIECQEPCIFSLPCGHACKLKCHLKNDPDHLKYKCEEKKYKNNSQCKKLCWEDNVLCTSKVKKNKSKAHNNTLKKKKKPSKPNPSAQGGNQVFKDKKTKNKNASVLRTAIKSIKC